MRFRAVLAAAALLVCGASQAAAQRVFPFRIDTAGEATADLTMSCPEGDWAREGSEAAMADIRVDGRAPFQVMLYAGPVQRTYRVFLGRLDRGDHRLTIGRNGEFSARTTTVAVAGAKVRGGVTDDVLLHAPVLYARKNTIGKFTDVPMVVYAERLEENGSPVLQYTVIFTNEDGGTSTRGLMARWGRTTDIEYVYRLDMKSGKAIIQTRDHKDVEFDGQREGMHPLLIPVTDNNMVAGEVPSAVRYQIAPVLVDLKGHSREQVMDDDAVMYRVAAQELHREDKLRPFGTEDGQKVSDPRNYVVVEARVEVRTAGLVTMFRRKDEAFWRMSTLGRMDYSVDRSGWIRTTVELPPGTKPRDIAEVGFTCAVMPDPATKRLANAGHCRVASVSKVFFLDREYRPGPSFWSSGDGFDVPPGIVRVFAVR
jgi:hypothetical protein